MSEDLLGTVKDNLANHHGCGYSKCLTDRDGWLRALVTRCEQAEAAYHEAQVTIAGLEAERDHFREQASRLRALLERTP